MDILPLTLFPEGGLVSSIITTVWVGVFVLCFFNLRFGWVLSGLVVPGYLVPLLIVKPFAAAVIVIEAVLAYLLVWLFSEKLSRGRFPSLFGRDRFMGLILASIAVRLSMDGYLLPEFAGWMEENFDRRIDWKDNLQSFGLVIISLLANQFWKPGLGRGVVMAVVTLGLTWFIVRYGLMELTNFRISGVSYLYEGLASSILASPKAYIILTLTAMIASHVNVKYGWDFSGILIPALIALQWYQPSKILTSFAEAIAIYCIARLILKLPMMANVTMEGGRKLLLFFNISFAWKMAIGWLIVWQGLEVKTTDFYGFGYLLSTLIAIKAHDKNIFPRLARSTLQVSLAGAVLGNVIGFTLSAATTRASFGLTSGATGSSASDRTNLNGLLVNAIGDAHVREARQDENALSEPTANALSDLITLFESDVPASAPGFDMAADGWRVAAIEGERFAIIRADGAGHELLVFDPAAERKLAIVLPDPTLAPGLGVAALATVENQDARWLVIGAPSPTSAVRTRGVTEVFADTSEYSQLAITLADEGESSRADFANSSAAATDIAALREAVPGLEVDLKINAASLDGDRASLMLNRSSLEHLASRKARLSASARRQYCRMSRKPVAAEPATSIEQLAFLRYEVAAPMIHRIRNGETPFKAIVSSRIAGFDLAPCRIGGRTHWSLHAPSRPEGHIFIANGAAPQKAVITYQSDANNLPPRFGAAIHRRWESDALFISTRSDSFLRAPQTSVDVVWQEWVRQQDGVDNPMTFQLRARPKEAVGFRRGVDVIIAQDRLGPAPEGFDELVSSLRSAGLRPDLVSGSREYAGLEARPGMSVRYFNETDGRRYAYGWLMVPGGHAK